MNELSITQEYPVSKFNLLGNTDVMVQIPDIKSPVIQQIKLDVREGAGDVYVHQKASKEWTDRDGKLHPAAPTKYAITKNGLKKLADGAGIKMISSEHVIPTTCQKCVAVNQHAGKIVQCGNCKNKDVAYKVTISVPQLTGEILTVEDTHEIIVDNVTPGMTDKQKAEFMKHLPQICEAKALNGAIRTALHIKGTYTMEELQKPFIVAYLVPNLNHDEVKQAAINNMFTASGRLFGMQGQQPSIQQIESRVPAAHMIEASDGETYDEYIDGRYAEQAAADKDQSSPKAEQPLESLPQGETVRDDFYCDKCGKSIQEKVWDYSVENFGRPLCYTCQRKMRAERSR